MNRAISFLAGLAVAGLMGCQMPPSDRLENLIVERMNASELHLSQRLERIEANQTALMMRFGFRPEGGK